MFKLEDFPFGEFGVTEESIITGVTQHIVGLGFNIVALFIFWNVLMNGFD